MLVLDSSHGHSQGVLDALQAGAQALPFDARSSPATWRRRRARGTSSSAAPTPSRSASARARSARRASSPAPGVPQVHAIRECAKATRGTEVPLIADGGIKFSGDVTKALAAGAHLVMIGSLLAGTEESPGETILYQGRTFKAYRGMGRSAAMKAGLVRPLLPGVDGDRARGQCRTGRSPSSCPKESRGWCPTRAASRGSSRQLTGGVRSGMGLAGCASIEELRTKSQAHPDHVRGPEGVPRPRRDHHQGSAELPPGGRLAVRYFFLFFSFSAASLAHLSCRSFRTASSRRDSSDSSPDARGR